MPAHGRRICPHNLARLVIPAPWAGTVARLACPPANRHQSVLIIGGMKCRIGLTLAVANRERRDIGEPEIRASRLAAAS